METTHIKVVVVSLVSNLIETMWQLDRKMRIQISWEPEGRHCSLKMFHWESEGRYRHRLCTAIVPFWFLTEHLWTSFNCNNAPWSVAYLRGGQGGQTAPPWRVTSKKKKEREKEKEKEKGGKRREIFFFFCLSARILSKMLRATRYVR